MRTRSLVLLGAAAGLLCGLVEAAWLLVTCWAYFDGERELVGLVGALLGLGGGVGVLAGLVVEGVTRALTPLAPARRALAVTALALPPIIHVCVNLFTGPRARAIPGHSLIAVALAVAACAVIYFGQRVIGRVPLWLAALVGVALYAANQKILPRLYPFFHQALALAIFGVACLVLFRRRWPRRWVWPLSLILLLAGGLAGVGLARQRALRTLLLERAVLAGPIVRLLPAPVRPVKIAVESAAAPPSLPPGPRLSDVDLFIITIDAFRADRLNDRTAPNLTALAAAGVRFSSAYAQVPHTSFSVATLLTGKYVYSLSELGLEAARHQTLAEVLKRERYKTAAFYPPSVFFVDHGRLKDLEASAYGFEYVKYEYLAAPKRTQQVIDFLESEKPRRAFVWVHYLEPHEPYDRHPGHTLGDTAEARYDGEIHYVDAEVARLVDYLRRHRPHSLIVVAADHGEEFGEHGGYYHGTSLYEEQVRVPLFITPLDEGTLPKRRVGGPVGLVDVAPTLLPLIGIAPSARMRGRDLGPWLSASGAPDAALGPTFAEIDRQKMIVDGSDKLICDLASDSCQRFDLAHDPAEHHNLVDSEPQKAERLRGRLDAWMQAETRFEQPSLDGVDAATRRCLERGRLGEAAAVPELARLLGSSNAAVQKEAARLLCRLPPDPATLPLLVGDDPWVLVARARLGDGSARLPSVVAGDELFPYVALVTRDPLQLSAALEQAGEDRALQLQLVAALGATHDPRALDALMIQLADVRTRVETVHAIVALGDVRAVPRLAAWAPADPYINVRLAMVEALARLGAHDKATRAAAGEALTKLIAVEPEPRVLAAARSALSSLHF